MYLFEVQMLNGALQMLKFEYIVENGKRMLIKEKYGRVTIDQPVEANYWYSVTPFDAGESFKKRVDLFNQWHNLTFKTEKFHNDIDELVRRVQTTVYRVESGVVRAWYAQYNSPESITLYTPINFAHDPRVPLTVHPSTVSHNKPEV